MQTQRPFCQCVIILAIVLTVHAEASTTVPNLDALETPIIFQGDATTAYRDPAVVFHDGEYHLFFSLCRMEDEGAFWRLGYSHSRDLKNWSEPKPLTPRDRNLNFSSPGNIVRAGDEWVICLQTYPTPQNETFGTNDSRIWILRSRDLRNWGEPELLRVKGPEVARSDMGRMIDPYLIRDINDPEWWWCFYKQNGVSISKSRDLKTWEYLGHYPAGENVCVWSDGGEYVMMHSPSNGLGIKRSKDLRNWRDDEGLITLGQDNWPWAQGRLTAGVLLDQRDNPAVGKYLLFFHGSSEAGLKMHRAHGHASLALAWSDDLKTWDWPGKGEKTGNADTLRSGQSSKPVVGAYYYPWYRGGREWNQVMRLHLKPPQTPKAGQYASDDPNVIAEHIAQSQRAGLTFWSVSWWGEGHITDRIFKNAILPHPDAGKLKYAMLYEATGRFGPFDSPNYDKWIGDLDYLEKNYFNHPYYLRIDGRPVLFVYLTREYFRNKGADALAEMREKFPQIYLVGDDVFGPGYRGEWAKNFDAVTAYDIYGQSVGRLGGTQEAIDFLATNYTHAKAEANRVGAAFMPAVAPGYNDTAVRKGHPGRARYFTDIENSKEGDLFRVMIQRAALPLLDPKAANMMMVTSFNEWYEDSQIEATAGNAPTTERDDSDTGVYYTGGQRYKDYGPLYLDILAELQK